MKKVGLILMLFFVVLGFSACSKDDTLYEIEPDESQMKSICELATLEYYFHNVATYEKKDVKQFLFKKWDKKFWIEYDGVVKAGIDVDKLKVRVRKNKVIITLPKAEILSQDVDETSISRKKIYVDDNSVDISLEDANKLIVKAQEDMEKKVNKDKDLLDKAQTRAKLLIEEYIKSLGEEFGEEYKIEWKIEK